LHIISKADEGENMLLRITSLEYQLMLKKRKCPQVAQTGQHKTPKYHNIKIYVYQDGIASVTKLEGHGKLKEKFDSIKEYNRCAELRLLERCGKISELRLQTPLEISPAFVGPDGKKHRATTYRADFTYVENGREIVEDVKGYDKKKQKYLCTEAFRLKWKLLQAKYPEKTFRIY